MGMTITVEIVDTTVTQKDIDNIFDWFISVDQKFSTYKTDSEISKINRGEIQPEQYSKEMKEVFILAEATKQESHGYFDIVHNNSIDPSGIVKGWAIQKAANMLEQKGYNNFYVDAGGDIQVKGNNAKGETWTIGIKNPFNQKEIVKVIHLSNSAIATSGTYIRGKHIYNPLKNAVIEDIVSMSVIGEHIVDADRFATAAFAMGKKGIQFIEELPGFEGYMIDTKGIATFTSGFETYV